MIKLRTLLLSNIIYYILLLFALIYFLIINNFVTYKSIYNDKKISGCIITNIIKKDYGIKLELSNKEKFIGYYYIKEDETTRFLNTYSLGDKIKINYEELTITNNTLDNTFNYKKYLYNKKIYKVLEITSITLIEKNKNIFYKIKNFLLERSYKLEKSYPYISTLLFGNSNYVEEDVLTSFRENGISHLFAISGTHIVIFIYILEFILKKIKISENKRYLIMIIFLIFYMFLTNFSMSVMRASIFTILTFINKIYYFNIKSTNLLLLALSVILFINPLNIYDIGLQYSFLISLGLILIEPHIKMRKGLSKAFIISLISFIISIPITINNFYQLNYLSIIYNIFFVPFVSIIILPLTIAGYVLPFLDSILYLFLSILENLSLFLSNINVLKFIYCKPSLLINVIYWVLIAIIILNIKKCKIIYYFPLIILLIANNIWKTNKNDYLTFIDVGQGDCCFLSVNDTYNLIDTGGLVMLNDSKYTYKLSKNKIIPYLKSLGIKHIDNLILTHGDGDHMMESYYIINNFKVNKIYLNSNEFNSLELKIIKTAKKKNIKIIILNKNEIINLNGIKLYSLNQKQLNENDSSIVLYTKINNYQILFTGDISKNIEKEIINEYNLKNLHILKLAHHGSKTSSSIDFLKMTNPKHSIISVGINNRFNHPHQVTIDNLNRLNLKYYETSKYGSITFYLKNGTFKYNYP